MPTQQSIRKTGVGIIQIALFIWVLDLFTKVVSTSIGKMVCGDTYMCAVDGVVGDCSCGFNTDMHLAFVLVTCMVFGLVLVISSRDKKSIFPIDIKNSEANE